MGLETYRDILLRLKIPCPQRLRCYAAGLPVGQTIGWKEAERDLVPQWLLPNFSAVNEMPYERK